MPWGPNQCDKIQSFDEAVAKRIEANNIVFAVHIPMQKNEMSSWFQFMLVILQFDIAFKMHNQISKNLFSENVTVCADDLIITDGHFGCSKQMTCSLLCL